MAATSPRPPGDRDPSRRRCRTAVSAKNALEHLDRRYQTRLRDDNPGAGDLKLTAVEIAVRDAATSVAPVYLN
jgi:hypothetical protein